MRGYYIFRQKGEVVARAENLITTAGRREFLRYIAGHRSNFAGSIGVGAGGAAPTLADTALGLEFDRLNIDVSSPDFIRDMVVFKGTLPAMTVGVIHEIGLWTSAAGAQALTQTLTAFDKNKESWSAGTDTAANSRLGARGLEVTAATNTTAVATFNGFTADFSRLSAQDQFTLGVYVSDANTNTLRVRFLSSDGNSYYEFSTTNISQGYNIYNFNINNLTKTGTMTLADIRQIAVNVVSDATDTTTGMGYTGSRVVFDALLLRPAGTFSSDNVLISRAVPGTPVVKAEGAPMDIEYYLDLDVV